MLAIEAIFERQQSFGMGGQQPFSTPEAGLGHQNQSPYPHANQGMFPAMLPPSAQPSGLRARRQPGSPQSQNQAAFNQNQIPFPDNG